METGALIDGFKLKFETLVEKYKSLKVENAKETLHMLMI